MDVWVDGGLAQHGEEGCPGLGLAERVDERAKQLLRGCVLRSLEQRGQRVDDGIDDEIGLVVHRRYSVVFATPARAAARWPP